MQELESADAKIHTMEISMERKIQKLTSEAIVCKAGGDMAGARKKLQERKTVYGHIEKLRSSQNIISMNLFAVRNAELNKSLVSTLKATGEAMKILAPQETTDIKQVEDVMFDLEDHVKRSKEVDDLLSKPVTNDSMLGTDSDDIDLELELLQPEDGFLVPETRKPVSPGREAGSNFSEDGQGAPRGSSDRKPLHTKKLSVEVPSVSFRPRTGDEMAYAVYN